MPSRRKTRPAVNVSNQDIVAYWSKRVNEIELNVDWEDAGSCCWSCGEERKLNKCHIVPHALGGKSEPSNLVLLCKQCHDENPNTNCPDDYWKWLKSRAQGKTSPFYWIHRMLVEYENIYGSDLCNDLASTDWYKERIATASTMEDLETMMKEVREFALDKFVATGHKCNIGSRVSLWHMFVQSKMTEV